MDRAVRAGHSERSIARSGHAVASAAGVAATPTLPSPILQRHFSFATYRARPRCAAWRRGAPQVTWYPPGSGAGGGRRAEAPELALLVQAEQAPRRVLGPPDVDAHVVDAAHVAQQVDGGARVGSVGEDLPAHHVDHLEARRRAGLGRLRLSPRPLGHEV